MVPDGHDLFTDRVLDALAAALERALGDDLWARGARTSALAMAARLIDIDVVEARAASQGRSPRVEAAAVLLDFIRTRGGRRGFRID